MKPIATDATVRFFENIDGPNPIPGCPQHIIAAAKGMNGYVAMASARVEGKKWVQHSAIAKDMLVDVGRPAVEEWLISKLLRAAVEVQ